MGCIASKLLVDSAKFEFCCYSTMVGENFESCASQMPRSASVTPPASGTKSYV